MSDFQPPREPPPEHVATPTPGWYFDGTQQRWWDGAAWGPVQARNQNPSSDDTTLATLAHLGALFGGFILPLVMYLISNDDKRPETRYHAREALNFSITFLILYLPVFVGFMFLSVAQVGNTGPGDEASVGFFIAFGLFMFFALATSIVAIVFGVRGAIRANKGIRYRYPICIRLLRS